MAKKMSFKKLAPHAGKVAMIVIVLFLAFYLIAILSETSSFYTQSAERSAKIYFDEDMKQASSLAEIHYERLYELVDRMRYAESKERVDEVIKSYIGSEEFGDLRYYCKGEAFSPMGDNVEQEKHGHEMILALSQGNVAGCTDVYYDSSVQMDCIAFFVPVRGSAFVDGVLSIVPAKDIISVGDVLQEKTSVVAVVGNNGEIYSAISAEGFSTDVGSNFYDFTETFAGNKEMVDLARSALSAEKMKSVEITAESTRFTMVAEPIEVFDGYLHLVTLSNSEGLIDTEVTYIRHIINILALAIFAFVVGLIYAFLLHKKTKESLSTANLTDAVVECANIEGFRRTAMNVAYGSGRKYAVGVYSIRQFHYVEDTFGQEKTVEVLKFITHVLSTFCSRDETYGYMGNGNFVVLIDYTNENAFRDKLMVFENIVNKYDVLVENNVKLKFAAGICLGFTGKRRTIPEMIDCAMLVCEEAKADVKTSFAVYTDTVRDKITRNEQIEAKMESALENNEFRLFLQPKYNAAGDCVDSAEALVRWFDPRVGDYIYPAEFISVFEANGFIVKMDHFVYIEVLKFISNAVERGDKVVPISVNVSRVTATSPDFVNFYVGNKRKYMVDDDLITLEFTESFAAEDYSKLREVVFSLHEGGIRCSVDDFGVGYSSFSVLKELAMDELKIDRLFLTPGANRQRDDQIIQTIVNLAKDMGMRVVQEGVENKELFDRVVGMGVEIIQGYYYAKAISVEEFKIFINSNTSIRYKAFVK